MRYLIKYGLVGVVATSLHISVAILLTYIYALDIVMTNWIAFSVAFFFSYIGNTKFVFEQKVEHQNFIKFFLVSMITLLIITVISYFGKKNQINPYIVIIIISIMIPLTTFLLHKTWTFKEKNRHKKGEH